MKKRIISVMLVLVMLIGAASATTTFGSPRWAVFRTCTVGITMSNGAIEWSGDASAYTIASVTSTKVIVKLQVATQAGWGTVETATDTDKYDAGAGGSYTGWKKGESYRVAIEAYAYNGTKELEYIGPFYDYLNT